jgi:dTDP-glucose 4,6-dehydratase
MIFVTGGAGFIGSAFILDWLRLKDEPILNIDVMTYAAQPMNLATVQDNPRYYFSQTDIADTATISALLAKHQPRAVLHFAAESHVDRSIHGPEAFVLTNVVGTFRLLDACKQYWQGLATEAKANFRFMQVSTDEVYGALSATDPKFTEANQFQPNSPYSASKASADHFVRAYHHTYGLPTLTSNCSNNYGPRHFPEKLIPLMILNALAHKPLPIYGDGQQIRDWLYVHDHASAIRRVLEAGRPGETYMVGGDAERSNLFIVDTLCDLLAELRPGFDYKSLKTNVADRPGHDRRYAIDFSKLRNELAWQPVESLETGLRKTVQWYLDNSAWVDAIKTGSYQQWLATNYQNRAA